MIAGRKEDYKSAGRGEKLQTSCISSEAHRETWVARQPKSASVALVSDKAYYPVLLLIATLSLWIRAGFPVHAIANATHDDLLFIRLARYLAAGAWLGPYNQLTLAKGMAYPLFIVIAHSISIPLKIAEHTVYLAACAAAAGVIRRHTGNSIFATILFTLLAFNPVLWHFDLARVIREGFYISLSLTVLVLTVVIAFPPSASHRNVYYKIVEGVTLGFVVAVSYLTREESIWLAPALAAVIVIALIGVSVPDLVLHWKDMLHLRVAYLKAIALPLALASLVFLGMDCLVATLNYKYYGIFETTEFRANSFLRAYGALTRIRHNKWHRYVLFPKDARQRAYAVSSAASELAGSLEGPFAEGWRRTSCSFVNVTPCAEVLGGWFAWEFRDAVSNAGYYRSAPETMNFYDKLANQIDSACKEGRLSCLPRRATLAPPFRWEYVKDTLMSGTAVTKKIFTLGGGQVGSEPSSGTMEGIASFADMVGSVYPPNDIVWSVRGWAAAATSQPPNLQLLSSDAKCRPSINVLPAPDVIATYPNLRAVRFEIETPGCPITGSQILIKVAEQGEIPIRVADLEPGAGSDSPSFRFLIEGVTRTSSTQFADPIQVKIAAVIASGYARISPVLAIFGAVGLLLSVLFYRRIYVPSAVLAFGVSCLVAVCTRILLLAYVDASLAPTANVLYSSPASPFVIIFEVIGIYLGYRVFFSSIRHRDQRVQ